MQWSSWCVGCSVRTLPRQHPYPWNGYHVNHTLGSQRYVLKYCWGPGSDPKRELTTSAFVSNVIAMVMFFPRKMLFSNLNFFFFLNVSFFTGMGGPRDVMDIHSIHSWSPGPEPDRELTKPAKWREKEKVLVLCFFFFGVVRPTAVRWNTHKLVLVAWKKYTSSHNAIRFKSPYFCCLLCVIWCLERGTHCLILNSAAYRSDAVSGELQTISDMRTKELWKVERFFIAILWKQHWKCHVFVILDALGSL